MCTFIFYFENGTMNTFEHIVQVKYSNAGTVYEIAQEKLLTHSFPIGKVLHLFSNDSNFSVSGNALCYIEIKKED